MELNDPLINIDDGAAMLGISVATFHRRVVDGTIPKPIKLGALSRWQKSDITGVIEAAKARRERVSA